MNEVAAAWFICLVGMPSVAAFYWAIRAIHLRMYEYKRSIDTRYPR